VSPSSSLSGARKTDGSLLDVSSAADANDRQGDGSLRGPGPHPAGVRSRTSSVSSQASDASMLASPSMPGARQSSSLMVADDGASEADADDHSSVVASMTKEELRHVYSKALRRGQQYKMKYLQVGNDVVTFVVIYYTSLYSNVYSYTVIFNNNINNDNLLQVEGRICIFNSV